MSNTIHRSPSTATAVPAGASMAKALVDNLRAVACTIVAEDDPDNPAKTTYRISGPNREAVQSAIDKAMRQVDVAFGGAAGMADFTGPIRITNLYVAIGVIIRDRSEAA